MTQKPIFGPGPGCVGQNYYAWSQCAAHPVQLCRLREAQKAAEKLCRSRIQDNSSRDYGTWSSVTRANDAFRASEDARELLQNPQAYLRRALNPFPDAMKAVYGPSRTQYDGDAAQAIYNYLYNRTRSGLRAAPTSPVVSAIQSTALTHLTEYHMQMLDNIALVETQIRDFRITQWQQISQDSSNRFEELRHQNREDAQRKKGERK